MPLPPLFDRPPLGLPPAATGAWEAFYRQALQLYGERYGAFVATKLCWDLWSRSTGRARPRPNPGRLPPPGGLVGLGYTLQVAGVRWGSTTIEKAPRIDLQHCLWSERLKAVLTFPRVKIPGATRSAESLPALLRLYRTWHDGKEPRFGGSRTRVPPAVFRDVWAGAVVVYRSDKFDADGEFVTYIHHLEPGASGQTGPLVYISDDCIMVRGGKLRLTKDGLAG